MTNLKIQKKIVDMLKTDNMQVIRFIEDILVDSEYGTVDEIATKYKRDISKYVEGNHETKMD